MEQKIDFIEVNEESIYDPLKLHKDAYFTQSWFYGDWQIKNNIKIFRYIIKSNNEIIGFFQALKYPLIFNQNYLYIPHGPIFKDKPTIKLLKSLNDFLIELGKHENVSFVRFDFFPNMDSKEILKIMPKKIKRTPLYSYYSAYCQSKFDWVLPINKSEEDLLINMHSKTRYNIKYAQKKGIKTEIISGVHLDSYFETFYKFLNETSERGKFTLRAKKYYKAIFDTAKDDPNQVLMIASYNNEILATYFIIFYGDTAYYPFGGSIDKYRNYMPTYLLHWEAIKEAKHRGCKQYNFGGIDIGKKITHENWSGISAFKIKFGGKTVEYNDLFDVVINSLWYSAYNFRKRIKK